MSRGQTRGGDLGGVVYREHAQYPVFAPGSSKVTVGCVFFFFFFWSLCIFEVQNLPQVCMHAVTFSPI